MSTHDVIAAWPVSGNVSKSLTRALLTKRYAYCFTDDEDVTAFTAADPEDGTLPLYLVQGDTLFQYDSTDTTTAHDGTTCLVTADGKRYKTDDVQFPHSVLNSTTTTQPTDPTKGDAYRVPTGATGDDWSGKDGKIAIYTARGWVFVAGKTGQLLYDEDKDTFYHLDADGSWVLGFGEQSLPDGAVLPSNMSGGGAKIRWMVENQTTNTPPATPTALVEYIVGTSPTGDWAGKAGQIARYENGDWTFYNPSEGWVAYDKNLNNDYRFTGTEWISLQGSWINFQTGFNAGNSNVLSGGTGGYSYSVTTAPTTSDSHATIQNDVSYTARRTGAKLRITIRCGATTTAGPATLGLLRDAETAVLDYSPIIFAAADSTSTFYINYTFIIDAIDTDQHTYRFVVFNATGGGRVTAVNRMTIDIEEGA